MLGKYKNTLIASVGSGIEYYDFIVYALMSPYLSSIFFHNTDPLYDLIHYFSVFALGYMFRPVGGVLLGYISDKYGRKKAFVCATSLMCIATFGIGFIPINYISSSAAIIVLITCRILQGISFGGELSNAITFIYESSKSKYLHGSFIFTSVGLGNILAIFAVNLLSHKVPKEEILSLWWRVPFIFGGVLMLVCFFFRYHLTETRVQHKVGFCFATVLGKLKKQGLEIALGILLSVAIASLIVTNLFFPTYFSVFYSYDISVIFKLMMYSMAFAVISSPLFGMLLNKKSDKPLMFVWGAILFVLMLWYFTHSIASNTLLLVFVFMSVYQIFIGFFFVLSLPFMTSLFDSDVRNTAVAFCYNIGYIIASFIPSVVTYFKIIFGKFFMFYVVGVVYLVLIFFIVVMFKIKKKLHYDRSKNYS